MIRCLLAVAAAIPISLTLSPPAQAAPTPEAAPRPAIAGHGDSKPQQLIGSESLSAVDRARQRAQEPLLNLNNSVYDLTSQSYDAQFAGAQLNVEKNTLVVYWAGRVPAELLGLRSEAAANGLTLTIRPARFSRKQLMAAADQVMPTGELSGTVELAVDGSGLTVMAGDLPAIVRGARPATAAESRLMQRISSTRSRTGVPIAVAATRPGTPQFDVGTRHNDDSPHWAGAQMRLPGGTCTSGFSMYASGAPTTRFTLTAAHCPNFTDGIAITNGAYESMGVSDFIHELYDHNDPAYDLGVVRLNAGHTNQPYVYTYEASSSGAIRVKGYASAGIPAGGTYCVHGLSAAGVNCNLYSGATIRQCTGWPPEGRCVYTINMIARDPYELTWCRGDSGGPIYYWTGSSVIAAGVVSWSNHEAGDCSYTGGASVVATAVNLISGLRVVTTSAP